jgi:hypothetical protein
MGSRQALAVLVVLASLAVAVAQVRPRVDPAQPPNQAVVGSRPVFQVAYSGITERELGQARFRIALSTDKFRSEAYVFDQRSRRAGWATGEEGFVVYLPRVPVADGEYEWRTWHWNGVEWVGGDSTFRLRIDTVPPAEIDDLALSYDPAARTLLLRWDPVTLDREGRPEFVARYRIYRYANPPFPRIPLHEIAVTESEHHTVEPSDEKAPPLLFFAVSAEDGAGNRTGDPRPEGR